MNIYHGVVEERLSDPLKLGRCKVRVFGLHSPDKVELPTEDLPWAIIMQPVNSAATSGIGMSPTGVVEGTVVVVMFTDEHKQQPIIIGTIAGIPVPAKDVTVQVVTTSESNSGAQTGISDSSASIDEEAPAATKKVAEIKKPTPGLVPSEDCYALLRDEEKLSSIVRGRNKFITYEAALKLPSTTVLYAYQDTKRIWTIGFGNTILSNGQAVNENTTISLVDAVTLFNEKVDEFAKGVRRNLKAPVTQSMFDALVSIAYNTGISGLMQSECWAAVQSTNYEQAAALIISCRNPDKSLTNRRTMEQKLFMKDGFPRKDMSGVDDAPVETPPEVAPDATQNPVVELKPDPAKAPATESRLVNGFRDPNGKYPTIFNEPDVHRLARSEKIDQTVVYSKEAARSTGVVTAQGVTWSQPPIPYNALYPYNHARVTESGHVQEFDDTPGNERVHTYHRSGTFTEIDVNGTQVTRIVGDDFEILERNGNVLIKGTCNVTVMGNSNLRVENNSNIDVLGNMVVRVGGNYHVEVAGTYSVKAAGDVLAQSGGNTNVKAGGNFAAEGSGNATVKAGGSFTASSGGQASVRGGGLLALDGAAVAIASGAAASAPGAGPAVTVGTPGSATGAPEFPTLTTPSRHDDAAKNYETPEDGDSTEYAKAREASGASEESVPVKAAESAPAVEKEATTPNDIDCSAIPSDGILDRQYVLSPLYTLGMLDVRNNINGPIVGKETKAQIVCNLKKLAINCLEPIKKKYPNMKVDNAYRNYVPPNGSPTSDHLKGCAADMHFPGFTRKQVYEAAIEISKLLPGWTQLILESDNPASAGWIHIAYVESNLKMDTFTMHKHKKFPAGATNKSGFTLVTT